MKATTLLLPLILGIASCHGQGAATKDSTTDWAMDLNYPSKAALDDLCEKDIKEIQRIQKDSGSECDLYDHNGQLFTGWACEVLENTPHKYRYEQFENGRMIRRLGYYDHGQIDADFRMKDCKNYGPSRMWLYDGNLYIDEFYVAPGVRHGVQKQYHDNGVLARESKFDHGQLLYRKTFDRNGTPLPPTP